MPTLLITGTDTEVGKTYLAIALAAYWQKYPFVKRLGLIKLIQTGQGDKELYQQLFGQQELMKIITPLSYSTPVAPPIAAAKEGKTIDLKVVWQALAQCQQQQDFVLLEALGGLGSPVTEELTVAHLAADWRLPTLLVVPVKLGAITQAVANVALARSLKVDLRGIVLNCSQPEAETVIPHLAPMELITNLTQIPVLGILPYLQALTDTDKLAQAASNLNLEAFFPVSKLVGTKKQGK